MKKTIAPLDYKKIFKSNTFGLVDRDRELRQLMYALLTKEHMLLMGKPGTAKSLFAINAFSSVKGAEIFQIHLTKQTTEEYVFGPLNIVELKKGKILHNTKGSILTADFAFLDEFFDASDVLLRSLLGVLNERLWLKGSQRVKAKLHTAILTSNYQRESKITQAILDRIVFKCEVNPSTKTSRRLKIYNNFIDKPNFKVPEIIDLSKLDKISKEIENPNSIKFTKDILEVYDEFLMEFTKETKKYISPRTANKALKVLKASAFLDKRDKVKYSDIEELKYVFCILNKRMEEEAFDAVYERCVGQKEEEKIVFKDLEDIEIRIKKIPTSFDNLSDEKFIEKMRELDEYTHLLEDMKAPTVAIAEKRDNLLNNIRKIVADNRDKLFKRKGSQT